MKKGLIILILISSLFIFNGCGSEEEVLRMGFVPMRDGEQLIESVKPLSEMISEEIGIKVEAFTADNYVGVVEAIGAGTVDFGFIPPFAYVQANRLSDARVGLTVLNSRGDSHYRSQFIVREDSDINSFEDIKGKKVAFVDPSSTSGYIFPAAFLMGQGIDIERDIEYLYSSGHDSSLNLLLMGDVDVAITFVDARDRYKADFPTAMEETRILGYTEDIPNISVTFSSQLDEEIEEKIIEALIKIAEEEEALHQYEEENNISEEDRETKYLRELFNIYGFVRSSDDDYEVIRDTMEKLDIGLE